MELILDWTNQREKWHQKLSLKCTQNCILHPFNRWCPPSGNHYMGNALNTGFVDVYKTVFFFRGFDTLEI